MKFTLSLKIDSLKVKGWRKIFHANNNQKGIEMATY
jgi:hypothetical protein